MMSLFSTFDAVCAEYLCKNMGFAFPSSSSCVVQKEIAVSKSSSEVSKNSQPSSMQVKEPKQQQKQRSKRFAVELDGLNCFETIVFN
ncbi:hypothetical protein ACHQM5_016365 [Ranunculus cassubicifolius]